MHLRPTGVPVPRHQNGAVGPASLEVVENMSVLPSPPPGMELALVTAEEEDTMTQRHEMGLDEALGRSGDGVCAIGSDGRIVLWNRSAEKIMGYTTREVAGKACCEVFVGKDDHGNRLCYQGCHVQSLVRMGSLSRASTWRPEPRPAGPYGSMSASWSSRRIMAVGP